MGRSHPTWPGHHPDRWRLPSTRQLPRSHRHRPPRRARSHHRGDQGPGELGHVLVDMDVQPPHLAMGFVLPVGVLTAAKTSRTVSAASTSALAASKMTMPSPASATTAPAATPSLSSESLDRLLESLDPSLDALQHPLLDSVEGRALRSGLGLLGRKCGSGTRDHQNPGKRSDSEVRNRISVLPSPAGRPDLTPSGDRCDGRGKGRVRSLWGSAGRSVSCRPCNEPSDATTQQHDPGTQPLATGSAEPAGHRHHRGRRAAVRRRRHPIHHHRCRRRAPPSPSRPLPAAVTGRGCRSRLLPANCSTARSSRWRATWPTTGAHSSSTCGPRGARRAGTRCPTSRQPLSPIPDVLIIGVAVDDDPDRRRGLRQRDHHHLPGRLRRGGPGRRAATRRSGLPATFVISADGMLVRSAFGRLTAENIDELIADALAG